MRLNITHYNDKRGFIGKNMPIMDRSIKSPTELQHELGKRLKSNRISRNFSQIDLATRAGVSLKTLRNLEHGDGSSVETLIRILKALDATHTLDLIAPEPTVSPMAILKSPKPRQRVRHSRRRT